MNKQSITLEQFRAVAGTMPACRAADALGISQANFYRLAQSYSISTAFVYKPWKPEEKQIAAELRAAGESHKSIAMRYPSGAGNWWRAASAALTVRKKRNCAVNTGGDTSR